ncbi:protein enabled-like protein [Senna tora]|uniref:Protein enabled-like protein n=1 Tax=Senna tora TaxID=362788 RepID=A0A834SPY0_9FABA|nr:protein enabled-like protein [Senna tora]
MKALLLAGPLPQWRHPPPPLDSFEIPPVTIPSSLYEAIGDEGCMVWGSGGDWG